MKDLEKIGLSVEELALEEGLELPERELLQITLGDFTQMGEISQMAELTQDFSPSVDISAEAAEAEDNGAEE